MTENSGNGLMLRLREGKLWMRAKGAGQQVNYWMERCRSAKAILESWQRFAYQRERERDEAWRIASALLRVARVPSRTIGAMGKRQGRYEPIPMIWEEMEDLRAALAALPARVMRLVEE